MRKFLLYISFLGILVLHFSNPFITYGAENVHSGPQLNKKKSQVKPKRTDVIAKKGVVKKSLTHEEFKNLVAQQFRNSVYDANSCGGSYKDRKSFINVPYIYRKTEPLPRLHWNIPSHIRDKTMREKIQFSKNPPIVRDSEVRACVNGLHTYQWLGFIQNGLFKIRMQFKVNPIIKTRIISQQKNGKWKDMWKWRESIADDNIPDYLYIAPCLEVYLTPKVENDTLTYGKVEVKWYWGEDRGFSWPQYAVGKPFNDAEIKDKVLKYKNDVMDTLKGRIAEAFEHNNLRNYIAKALTAHVKSGEFTNFIITAVSGAGEKIQVSLWPK